jgi:hypothetical protein
MVDQVDRWCAVGEVVGSYCGGVGRAKKRSETQLLNFPATPGVARDVLRPARTTRFIAFGKVGGTSLSLVQTPMRFW